MLVEVLFEAILLEALASLVDFEFALAEADLLALIDEESEELVDFEALSEASLIDVLTEVLREPGVESALEMLTL
ncbi:hypothetical protein M3M35_06870 [Fructilactobacillus myrtifloralis]|uniref:Carrier domain-containing protein n=1 Tax=Fructilactobacillus myrtifloralis TaxID=2940301 RepID=A0ABY5BMV1_9LACO|nr:hypothetical protein [Fructilactobacillus myrtifloralis]USS85004.1 hypothetical protein M3M35_06870 [Fructilactobacillus myrtifloralis]